MVIKIGFGHTINLGECESIRPTVEMEFRNDEIVEPSDPKFVSWYNKCEQIVEAYYFKEFQKHSEEALRRRLSDFYAQFPKLTR